jgi:polysaccharide biosynthesis/export protein
MRVDAIRPSKMPEKREEKQFCLAGCLLLLVTAAFFFGCLGHLPPKSEKKDGEQAEEYILPMETIRGPGNIETPPNAAPYRKLVPGDELLVFFSQDPESAVRFLLRPQDIIEVRFPDVPSMNVEQPILPNGKISLPYIADPLPAAGRTAAELTGIIRQLYVPILRNPELFVVVKEYGKAVEEFQRDISYETEEGKWKTDVGPDGRAVFPIIGELFIMGKTIPEVRKDLQRQYRKILDDIRIDLAIDVPAAMWIVVLGEVQKPGYHKITRPVSILEALALANGYTREASLDSAVVIRRESERVRGRRVNVQSLLTLSPEAPPPPLLSANDVVYVPRATLPKLAEITRRISEILFFRGWSIGFSRDVADIHF